jgi:eukaryotic-like serine/threonine-protein kinase
MIGRRLGTFLIDKKLGKGSMGTVYRGVRETCDRQIAAIKVINSDKMAKGTAFRRFIREIEILQKLHHENIVEYLAHGKSGKTHYYAMEYIRGPNLDKLLAHRGPLFWVDVVRYAIQICEALDYSHEHQVVHRDLKPSNLMVTADGKTIKLTDFGIAKDLDAPKLTESFLTLGSAPYMSPEQFRGAAEVSHKTDLYALGVVMYQMLTGELPFPGATVLAIMNRQIHDERPRPSAKIWTIPVQLDDLVVTLMAKMPQDRPLDAGAVAVGLRGLLARLAANKKIRECRPKEGTDAATATPRGLDGPVPKKIIRKKKRPYERFIPTLPTLGLLFSLFAIGAVIAYGLARPSAEYLHDKAKRLMDSEDRSDWLQAPTEYLDDLDRWYPNHRYKAETEDWRDRIALSVAERRAEQIEWSPIRSKPTGQGEVLFAAVFPEAEAALKRYADADAVRHWREMAARLEKEGSKSMRGWILLANRKAAKIEATIADRASAIATGISQADAADREGLPDRARAIRRDLLNRFEKYADTAEAVKLVRTMLLADKE